MIASLLLLLAGSPGPGVSPAALEGVRFYDAEFVDKVKAGRFDPFEYWDHSPFLLHFDKAGHVVIEMGQEAVQCRVAASGAASKFSVRMPCDGGSVAQGEWTWLGPGRARSNVWMQETMTLAWLDQTVDELVANYEKRYAAKAGPTLAGTYADDSGQTLRLGADGKATLGGRAVDGKILECLVAGARTPCVELGDTMVALVKGDLVGGQITEDLTPEGRTFEVAKGGTRFRRK